MLLRASGEDVELSALTSDAESGVPSGRALIELVCATLGDDLAALELAREQVRQELGYAGLGDAAAVMSSFQKVNRIADGTGISLDTGAEMASRTLRGQLGLDRFGSAANTPAPGRLQDLGAGIAERVLPLALRVMSRLQRRKPRR